MKDWKALAKANGLDMTARELDRLESVMVALDTAFRPLVKDLPADLEPASQFHMEDGE